jgi:phosphatidylglycerophosphate synthase
MAHDPRGRLAASAALTTCASLVALLVTASGIRYGLGLDRAFVLQVLGAFLVGVLLMGRLLPQHLPQTRLGAANQVTLVRGALVALLVGLVGEGGDPTQVWLGVATASLAASLDGLDGWLARRHGTVSGFGARFDMETDAVLIAVLSVLAWELGKAGPWILLAGLMRYLFVAASYAWPWLRRELPPSRRRQTVCVVQIISLILSLAPVVPRPASAVIAAAGLLGLGGSFLIDVLWLARRRRGAQFVGGV